mmetsp:Transcript_10065/g.28214  ORF Transcript_10065/g.28214 Transcript_10065/m.28214 type:complete len:272 (-) Transcript_10065:12-827(-)
MGGIGVVVQRLVRARRRGRVRPLRGVGRGAIILLHLQRIIHRTNGLGFVLPPHVPFHRRDGHRDLSSPVSDILTTTPILRRISAPPLRQQPQQPTRSEQDLPGIQRGVHLGQTTTKQPDSLFFVQRQRIHPRRSHPRSYDGGNPPRVRSKDGSEDIVQYYRVGPTVPFLLKTSLHNKSRLVNVRSPIQHGEEGTEPEDQEAQLRFFRGGEKGRKYKVGYRYEEDHRTPEDLGGNRGEIHGEYGRWYRPGGGWSRRRRDRRDRRSGLRRHGS